MSQIVIYIMVFFAILGVIDKLIGNRLGLGQKFDEGFNMMGSLAISMLGIYCLSPVMANWLLPALLPLSKITGADPSIFISSVLACDMGAYSTAVQIAQNETLANFSGIILGAGMGATISFTIPISTSLVRKEDFPYFAKGILSGLVTIPVGCIAGGLMMGVPMNTMLINLVPVIILSIVIAICLIKLQDKIIQVFGWIGKIIFFISMIGLILNILDFILGIKVVPGMIPFEEGLVIVGKATIVLSGAYCLIYFISKILKNKLSSIGKFMGINDISVLGIITSLASNVPMLGVYKDMDWKGKIINASFAVGGAFVVGGQLGFISGISKEMVAPFVVSKIVSGISGIAVSYLIIKLEKKPRIEESC